MEKEVILTSLKRIFKNKLKKEKIDEFRKQVQIIPTNEQNEIPFTRYVNILLNYRLFQRRSVQIHIRKLFNIVLIKNEGGIDLKRVS